MMRKTILITGSTDGIGLATAKLLASCGHHILLHGRSSSKLRAAHTAVSAVSTGGSVETWLADLSVLSAVDRLGAEVRQKHARLDVVINNAGVFKTGRTTTADGLDVRFAVNAIAPYLLTRRLLPALGACGRVVNVTSAAQRAVDVRALAGRAGPGDDMSAYAQSKLALTMWSAAVARGAGGVVVVAVNPGSMLGSKMVREGFGVDGGDVRIGAEVLVRAAVSEEFAGASGKLFDNDAGRFSRPHADALDVGKAQEIVRVMEEVIASVVD